MYSTTVKEDPHTGDLYIEFDPGLMEELGWKEGDDLIWEGNNKTFYVRKKDASSVERTE